MTWHEDPNHAFTGIAEKLHRAKENIFNLDSEISTFFQEGDYSVIPENDHKSLFKAIEYHKNRVIPPRFSVLSGEIVHHLRSCFDHVVWHFSGGPISIQERRRIEFPVFEIPLNHDRRTSFEGKINRISHPEVRSLIEKLQPYNATEPLNDPLWIIHDLDITDKHRELVFSEPTGERLLPVQIKWAFESYCRAHPELEPAEVAHQFKDHGPLIPNISFRDAGGRNVKPVIPCLTELFDYTVGAMEGFAEL